MILKEEILRERERKKRFFKGEKRFLTKNV